MGYVGSTSMDSKDSTHAPLCVYSSSFASVWAHSSQVGSRTICLGWLWAKIFLLSASGAGGELKASMDYIRRLSNLIKEHYIHVGNHSETSLYNIHWEKRVKLHPGGLFMLWGKKGSGGHTKQLVGGHHTDQSSTWSCWSQVPYNQTLRWTLAHTCNPRNLRPAWAI
jgi:hypothetical protein